MSPEPDRDIPSPHIESYIKVASHTAEEHQISVEHLGDGSFAVKIDGVHFFTESEDGAAAFAAFSTPSTQQKK